MALQNLILQRGFAKRTLTNFGKFVNELNEHSEKITQIPLRIEQVIKAHAEFNDLQKQIELEDPTEEQYAERVAFEDRYFENLAKAQSYLQQAPPVCDNAVPTAPAASTHRQQLINLPEISLPEFAGDYSLWYNFRDIFGSLIDSNPNISDIQKFHYLASSLKGQAAQVIQSLEISAGNYSIAWELLKQRFEKKKVIMRNHLNGIFEIHNVAKNSHQSLRSFLDEFQTHYRALQNLGEKVDTWDTILIHLLLNKLDLFTKRDWENATKNEAFPSLESFTEFLADKCNFLESIETKTNQSFQVRPKIQTLISTNGSKCPICKKEHRIYACAAFLALSNRQRLNEIKKLNLCVNCLQKGHVSLNCKFGSCKVCKRKHNTLVHINNSNETQTDNTVISQSNDPITSTSSQITLMSNMVSDNSIILLSTVEIFTFDNLNKPIKIRALLDSASQSNFISESLFKKLKLDGIQINRPVMGLNSATTNIFKAATASVKSTYNGYSLKNLNFLIVPKITGQVPQITLDLSEIEVPEELRLADPFFYRPARIDMLLGAAIFYDIISTGKLKLGPGLPTLVNSKFGWIVSGSVNSSLQSYKTTQSFKNNYCNLSISQTIHKQLENFWKVEESQVNEISLSKEERECESHFIQNFYRDQSGRFIVKLPLKNNAHMLGETKIHAKKRFFTIEQKLLKNPKLQTQYIQFMREYIKLGHMSEITHSNDEQKVCYLPHHFVFKDSSLTTKCRIVFDASLKSSSSVSLNNILMKGPVIQEDIFSIMVRFRKYPIAFSSDIEKMYRQIMVNSKDRDLQRIVWRESLDQPLIEYNLNTVTYGMTSSSFLATRCLKQLALENCDVYPDACSKIQNDFYMDDLISGADSEASAKLLISQINKILLSAGFPLRQWMSNYPNILKEQFDNTSPEHLILTNETCSKTLGIMWRPASDTFSYTTELKTFNKVTKRIMLSVISQIFDPLGLLGPIIIKMKVLLQRLWRHKLSWDQPVPEQILTLFNEFNNDLQIINSISIPRFILVQNLLDLEIHCFTDASLTSYGCCIYTRCKNAKGEVQVQLICAKSRVAPLKQLTLPRLELCGALLGANLTHKVINSLKLKTCNEVFYWSDSTITLYWILSETNKLKTFVANRVAQIQNLSNKHQWKHVSSTDNPADLISRGVKAERLRNSQMWWNGPNFLKQSKNEWPRFPSDCPTILPETKILISLPVVESNIKKDDFSKRFSCFKKLINVTAYCIKFKNKCFNRSMPSNLTLSEINHTKQLLIKLEQEREFSEEIKLLQKNKPISLKSKLISLNPFFDDHGILRVGGRLVNSNFEFNKKFPIILPSKSHFTKLLIKYEHERAMHAGPELTLSLIREQYWPIHGRSTLRSLIRQCHTCFRSQPICHVQKMGNLPATRVNSARVFSVCAIDYAGPYLIKDGKLRNRKFIKAYICIFNCFVSKAVHFEIVTELTATCFLNALKRFTARRGVCNTIYSDNATNFRKAQKDLNKLGNLPKDPAINNYCMETKINWKFIPARTPHFNGLVEAAVKMAKKHLKRVASSTSCTYEEFNTLLIQIEAVLNSRPLIPLSNHPNDLQALTPGHFLIGQALLALPENPPHEMEKRLTQRYELLKSITAHFWRRWNRDYIHHLHQRSKWKTGKSHNPLSVGTMVVLKEDNVPPQFWKLGRIVEVHPGSDGVVRVVSVKTANGIMKRGIVKVAALPMEMDYN